MQQPIHNVASVPVMVNPTIKIRRALRRQFAYAVVGGGGTIDGGGPATLQVTFAPSSTDWRIGGASVYSDVLPNVTEFSNLFDQWKLVRIYLRIDVPMGYSNSGAGPIIVPNLYYVPDYDDSQNATLTDILQYPQVKQHQFNLGGYTPLIMEMSPKPLRDVAGSGISTTYGPMTAAPWLRTADMSTPHYGIKIVFDTMGVTTSTAPVTLVATLYYDLEFTNPK